MNDTQILSNIFWHNKIASKEKAAFSKGPIKSLKKGILKENFEGFIKVAKNNSLSKFTIVSSVFSFVINKYFENYQGFIKVYPSHLIDLEKYLLLEIGNDARSFKKLLQNTATEVKQVFSHKNYNSDLNIEPFSNFSIQFGKKTESLNDEISLLCEEIEDNFLFTVFYKEKYPDYVIESLLKNVINILSDYDILLNKNKKDYSFVDKEEVHQLLVEFNNTKREYPSDKTVVKLVEEQVQKTPDNVAVVFEDIELTYHELNGKANQLANYIKEKYIVENGEVIAILLPKSVDLLVSLLAIEKIGCIYLPIDINYPKDRIDYILEDSKAKILLSEQDIAQTLDINQPYISLKLNEIQFKSTANLNVTIESDDVAYLIYTSGSTGRPKGVLVEHHSNINMSLDQIKTFGITAEDKIVWFASVAFDASISEIMMSLYSGATLCIPTEEEQKDKDQFISFLEKTKSTVVTFPPSYLELLPEKDLKSLKTIITAGEPANPIKAKELVENGVSYYNAYGPTEYSVCTSIFKLSPHEDYISVPIGVPISNTSVYILDEDFRVVPIGVSGTLYVSGAGLSRGYLNKPELTREKFIDNPFEAGTKMYDTGDLARWLPDGNIEFLGRKDFQVKIRGYRIELGEIEMNINWFSPSIRQVVTDARDINGEKVLVAYYTNDSETSIDKSELREYLQSKLPDYMIPGFFVELENIPLTPNGKIDRKALPGVTGEDLIRREYVAPRNATDEKLSEIWQKILGVEKVGITDNFFELGGHSLMVAQVLNRIHQSLSMQVSFKDFFASPSIEGITKSLTGKEYTPIPKAPEQENYPLTPSQQRLWILSQLEGGSQAYNMPAVVTLRGELNEAYFEKSFQALIDRHEILRTSFKSDKTTEEIRQYIILKKELHFTIEVLDFSGKNELEVEDYLQSANNEAFNLEESPLIRATLLKRENKEHLFFLSMHHIIGDGWSTEVLVSEVVENYNNLLNGNAKEDEILKEELAIQYKDYAVWLQEEIKGEKYRNAEAYWLEQFEGELPVLELPSYKTRPLIQTYNGNNISHLFSKEFTDKLKQYSEKHGVTLFMTLMAGIKSLLYRYTGQQDIIVGTPLAGREHPDLENQIGLYLNTLAIRTRLEGDSNTFESLLKKERDTLLSAYEHQLYPFDELVGKLNIKRDMSRSALFDVLVVFQSQGQLQIGNAQNNIEGLQVEGYDYQRKTSQFDVSYAFAEEGEQLGCSIEYNTDIYDEQLIQRMFGHFENLLTQAIENTEDKAETTTIEEIDFLTEQERQQLLHEFNDTKVDYPSDKTIIELFEKQVEKTPKNVAVVFEDTELTYRMLNEQANQLGDYLRQNYKIEPDDLVAIKLERSERMIVAILGILKSGAAYVPVDPEYPEERIEYIEHDTQAKVTIDAAFLESYHEELKEQKRQYTKQNLPIISRPDSLAYVIYTSGTTGSPKGVMMQQENILNLIKYHIKTIAPYNKVTFLSNPSFDVSFQEIFSTLLTGATLFPVSDTIKKDIQALTYFISKNKLDVLFFPTAYFKVLIEDDSFLECVGENVKHIIVAGEKLILNNAIFESINEKLIKIHNHYGPAETHVVTTYVIDEKTVKNYIPPIGKPIANIYVYILNTNKVLCSIGEYGRLYLSGAGLAKGYINKKELTEEKFIANPFIPGSKMYDTGDIARWLPDGNIEFLGRKDFQVKVRGYRIETNEVETVLTKHNSINQTIVDTKEINGDNILIAFYVKKDPTEKLDKSELRDYMQSKVPEYMVPGFFIEIDSVPLTPNGKINRRALPDVKEYDMVRKEYVAPKNEIEKKLVKIWQEVLGIEKVGITDSFFELGGNSIKAMQFISILNSRHKMSVELSVLFKNPHIQYIAYSLIMEKKEIERFEEISEPYKLSPQQMNMWISEVKNNTSNIIVTQLIVDELLDINLLKKSIDKIVQRHLSLRTVFITHDNLPLQKIITNDYDKYDINIISEEDLVAQNLENDFSLDEYPLFKIYVIPKQDRFKVVLKIHHLIFDGWSVNLFRNELLTIYKNKNNTLPGTNYEYIDYVNYLKHQNKDILLEYWKNKLKDVPDYLHISNPEKSIDHEVAYTSNYADFQIDNRSYDEIKKIIKQRGVTLSTFFISCFKILLGRISNTNNITVAIPVAKRNDPAFSNIIGLFTNIIFHNDLLNQHASFEKLLDQVHSTSIEALNHADISVHEICDLLKINNTVHTLPLTPVVINILDFIKDNFEYEPGCDDKKDHLTASKFDLEFFVETTSGGVLVSSVFNKDLFNSKEVFFWLKGLGHIIDEVIHHSEKIIEEIEIFDQFLLSDPVTPKNDYVDWELEYDSIIDRFDYICETYPDKYAVVDDNQKITYRELNETSTIISNEIIKHSRNNKVLILLSHGYQSVLGILSTLKAGKAYIPLDISLHTLRTREIIAEINTDLILCDNQTEEFANKFLIDSSLVSVNIERIINQDSQGTMQSLEEIPSADSLAYILYTSGSTGKPKGVMQSHKNVLHFINIYTRQLHIAPEDHLSLIPFYNFDSAVMDIFGGLLNGATLYPFNVNIKGINDLARWIDHHEITIYHSVPTLFRSLIKTIQYRLSSIRLIVLGGEAVFKRDFLEFKNKFGKDAIFINGYGPTESTIVCQKFLDDQSIVGYHVPIGKPVDRTKVYLVKSGNKPARIYEEGEIVYGSDYLALGYYQDETLTNQKFKTKADFQNSDPNLRYYYSGDWGKLLPSGDIEFIGRLDNQIKLNGIRIELNEINFVIEQIAEVAVSVTVFKTFRDNDLISSYICFKAGNSISREAILEILKSSLPAYMVPKSIVILDHIPLTNTGKISFKDLPDIQENDLFKKEFTPAGNVLEKELENIWKDILKIDQIGIHDNFFDIGGTSVRAIELSNKLKINYPDKNISPVIVFEYPNISTLAEFLSTTVTTTDQEQEENLSILETTLNIYNLDHNDYDE